MKRYTCTSCNGLGRKKMPIGLETTSCSKCGGTGWFEADGSNPIKREDDELGKTIEILKPE